ncbi:MAG: Cation-efflux family protein, partial [Parcubacteria group bacterium GW2011_GWC2_42_11]
PFFSVLVSPTAAALNVWLRDGRVDIPMAITNISFQSYNTPITSDGTLPVRLFGRTLNLNRFREKGCTYAVFYAPDDDLVEPEVALAGQQWATHVEALSGGHVKKATSPFQKEKGPERLHLGLAHTPVDISLLSQSLLHYRESYVV